MNAPDSDRWRHTSPLAAVFYLGKIYEAIAKNAVQSLAPLVAFLFAYQGDLVGKIVLGVGAFVTVTVIAAFLRYWFFRYKIADGSILIREGVLRKTQLDIKFDRIQAINAQQSILFRLFDLVTVKIDTAGSAKQEGHLPAIRSALADSLKERIRKVSPAKDIPNAADDDGDAKPADNTILRLGAGDMVRIGLSSNRILVFLAILAPFVESILEKLDDDIDETVVNAAVEGGPAVLSAGAGVLIVFGVLLFLVTASIIGAFLRYHRFELVAGDEVLRSSGGLLTRHEHSVNLVKIQSLFVAQNPVMRLFRRLRLLARQASSGRPGRGKHFIIPLCTSRQLPVIAREIFGEEFQDAELNPRAAGFNRISPRYMRSRIMLTGVLPALVLTGLVSLAAGFYSLVFLSWIPLDVFFVWIAYRKYGYAFTANGMILRRGFLGFRLTAFMHRKVQRVSVTQSLPQRRKGLATVRVFLGSGSAKLPYVDYETAKRLRDYMLYKVESSQLAWH